MGYSLKCIAEPTQAWRVEVLRRSGGRFDAAHAGSWRCYLAAGVGPATGEGQAVLVGGEPGIGKSRIVSVLREKLLGDSEESVIDL